jgi:hypothetical protein
VLTFKCEKYIEEKKRRGNRVVEKNKRIERKIVEEKT